MLFLAQIHGDKLVKLQNPSDAMLAFNDDRLNELGLFSSVRGPHARDALRHGLLYLRTAKLSATV